MMGLTLKYIEQEIGGLAEMESATTPRPHCCMIIWTGRPSLKTR